MRVVFTGKGHKRGALVERAEWIREAYAMGHEAQAKVDYRTSVLVASRSDTSKAINANAMNIPVWTYQEWSNFLDGRANPPIQRTVTTNRTGPLNPPLGMNPFHTSESASLRDKVRASREEPKPGNAFISKGRLIEL